jgi:flagellar motor protein MotB
MRTRGAPKEEKPQVPAYIVTFSDMVTLLLTFFVLLLTMAEVQDPEMFNRGRDSFIESLRLCGLGNLLGSKITVDIGAVQTQYRSDEPETSEDRSIDEYREKLRRAFERISRSAATLPSQLTAQRLHFRITDVRFPAGQAALDDAARQSLSTFCVDVQQNLDAETHRLYVLGLAGDETSQMQQWMLSARRAEVVAEFLRERLSRTGPGRGTENAAVDPAAWQIFWWGAGPGGNWAGQDQPDPGESQILIAILRTGP